MGLVVDKEETKHYIDFEVRSESVVFWDIDDERVELTKELLWRIRGLLNDPEWADSLVAPPTRFPRRNNDG